MSLKRFHRIIKLAALDYDEQVWKKVPLEQVARWHRDPPLPTSRREPGEDRYLVYQKYVLLDHNPRDAMHAIVHAKDEQEAMMKAIQNPFMPNNIEGIGISKETSEHAKYLEFRKKELDAAWRRAEEIHNREKAEKERNKLRDNAQRELHSAERKGADHRYYHYHMAEFARYMREAAENLEDAAKYQAMELEHTTLQKSQPKKSLQEIRDEIKRILTSLNNIGDKSPSFGPEPFKKSINSIMHNIEKTNYSPRFIRIAQLLFTSDISDEELSTAQKVIDIFNKSEIDLQNWIDSIEKNLEVFKNYHGKEKSLVVISEAFEKTIEKQKQKYEEMISSIKQGIELLHNIQDVEMQDMVTNLTKTSEEYTELYNELTNMQLKIGETGFIQEFKDISQKIIDGNEPLFDVLNRIKDYMMKNIMGEQSLS